MTRAARAARRVWLPSGRVVQVRIDPRAVERRERKRQKTQPLFADVLALLTTDRFVVEDAASGERLDARAIDRLPLRDFHVLRDLAIRSKLVPSEPELIACDNCDEELEFDGASLPVDDLDDRYEGEEPATETRAALPAPVSVAGKKATHLRMRPVTVADARTLWRELGKDRAFRITPPLLASMGVVALEADEPVSTDRRAIAKALDDAPDETWSVVEETFLSLAYPPRALAPLVCPRCETIHDMEVPWPRELEPGQYHRPRDPDAPFPAASELEARAREIADRTFREMDVGGLTLRVEVGVPEVDSGGVPMLGSYTPEARDDGGTDFVVRVYYRTFERAFRDDPTFDWEHELAETIEHEAQHHAYYLSGHDPMDAQERAESERELVRRVGGEKRYRKLRQRALLADVWEIVRVLVPAFAVIALALALLSRCGG